MHSRLPALVAIGLIVGLAIPSVVGAKPASSPDLHRARVIAYWTPARIASAVPRGFVREAGGKLVPNGRPVTGGDGTTVSGASWTKDGEIEERSGRVLFTMGGSNWICSASVVTDGGASNGYSTIVTAGHCVTDGPSDWASMWMFIPDFDDAPIYTCDAPSRGCWVAERLAAHATFESGGGFGNDTVHVDYGFARVGLGGVDGGALLDLDDLVGAYSLRTSATSLSDNQWAFGYPAEGKYKGKDLIYCRGSLIADPYGSDTWGMGCKMNGGSSGGPWLHGTTTPETDSGTVSSVNSYGYAGLAYMFGPKFNSQTTTVLASVISGSETGGVSAIHDIP